MGLLGNLKTDNNATEQEERLSTGSHRPSDVYDFTINMAYMSQSAGGAIAVNLILKDDAGEFRQTTYISNKDKETFYYKKDKDGNKTDEKILMPGYQQMNSICLLTTGKGLDEMETEEKTVRLYDFEEKKELPKSVEVLTELSGTTFKAAVLSILENKNVKNDAGKYVASAETREINEIDFVAHSETGATVTELRKQADGDDKIVLGGLLEAWLERNKGKQKDKREIKDGQGGGAKNGRPQQSSGGGSEGGERKTNSLFKK